MAQEYLVFVSTYHATNLALGVAWKKPNLGDFIEYLTHEKENIIQMGYLKYSEAHALAANRGSKKDIMQKEENKGKKEQNPRFNNKNSSSKVWYTGMEIMICTY